MICVFFVNESVTPGMYPYGPTLSQQDALPLGPGGAAPAAGDGARVGRPRQRPRDLSRPRAARRRHESLPLWLSRRPGARLRPRAPLRRRLPGEDFRARSEEHTSELQSLMRISYAVFCLKKKNTTQCKMND